MHPFLKFCIVGVTNTIVDFSIYFLLTREINFWNRHHITAKAVSFFLATIWSFIANRKFTFEIKSSTNISEFLRFYIAIGSGVFINTGVYYLCTTHLRLNDLIGVIFATFVTSVYSFSFLKLWVFSTKK